MHRSTRMLAILMRLQHGPSTLRQLAASFDCSTKTIQRDIEELVSLNIPVIANRGYGGGIAIDPGWWLGPLNLSPAEIETIILAMENAPFLPGRDEVLAKVRAAVRPGRFDPVADNSTKPVIRQADSPVMHDTLAAIRNVMQRQLWCRIDYHGGSKPGWRLILPQHLHITENRWYLRAIDERSRESRVFRLDRIRDLQPALGPANARAIIDHARSLPTYNSEEFPEVVANLTDAGMRFCLDHPDFQRWVSGHELRFRCPPHDYGYCAREMLRMGADCTIEGPPDLVTEIKRQVTALHHHIVN